VSILSAHDVRLEDISDLVGRSGTSVTETVYRHEIRPSPRASRYESRSEGEGCKVG
jgi:hypothetical protein